MGLLEDLSKQVKNTVMHPPDDEDVQLLAPNLWELLTRTAYGEKKDVPPADLKIERVAGGYRVAIVLHALRLQKHFNMAKLSQLVEEAEKCLLDASVPWEKYKSFKVKEDALKKILEKA